ncbi:carboxymuconolactone decarboxylase family protein [Rhodococcus triatomae]|uniref:Alkylhydroperoxidase AhpD family core domain-containing protein n=1 Tax=Rhodococcus triatomae TaxID=300028 RepID=A0A1G8RK38_9NOCA|nr:carboxymuconolactone decarboxylase family protein [Rhodococcus triatomae]QNG19924.1 carboxymuconolactone decarboxylase family protein [Rhodococcus triatomae]QNG24161.1 carboxymuconolactone decarboxylase family protein [Rhodococcus triatomae]SDJ17326.1 alkylhydroperoxidase AhpD family core domain-containing protein [Rhodococcus triatomae]
MGARITPGRFGQLGPINWVVWRVLSVAARAEDAHLFSTLGRTRGLFRGWLHYSGTLMPGGRISRHETELIILRVAHLRDCAYEMDHHVRLGRRAGVTPEILDRVLTGPDAPGWSDRHRVILAAVDELVASKDLDDPAWNRLAEYFDDRRLIEFCLLVTQYDGLATTIGTLRIERDHFA